MGGTIQNRLSDYRRRRLRLIGSHMKRIAPPASGGGKPKCVATINRNRFRSRPRFARATLGEPWRIGLRLVHYECDFFVLSRLGRHHAGCRRGRPRSFITSGRARGRCSVWSWGAEWTHRSYAHVTERISHIHTHTQVRLYTIRRRPPIVWRQTSLVRISRVDS